MSEERTQQCVLQTCVTDRVSHFSAERENIVGDVVGQVCVLRAVPDLLNGVEIRGVGRKPLNLDTFGKTSQKAKGSGTVNLPSIHDESDRAAQPPQDGLHERLEVVRNDVVIEDVEIQAQPAALGRNRNGRDGGEAIATVPTVVDGCLPERSQQPAIEDCRLEKTGNSRLLANLG